ncbi:X-ray radiation resistance-associated protein 1 [Oopsacas minuta]|uniref:X-ray radiation resistance-associated protein 1 n=1 Tax=Oopsacas minuta TaxID=111878 RepID=A0AAV7KA20_9METZ|nr:X-ray radiation resistance-associated protein 1 [Oopsacas minuta]
MFPARKLGGASSGGGEWLTAFKTAERERCHAILSAFPRSLSPPSRRNINTPMSDSFIPLIFSQRLLLDLHGISSPLDLCIAHVAGMELCEWKEEEDCNLNAFANLTEVDASDNSLPLEAFFQLTALRCLDLSVNQISKITLHEDNLNKLQILDLSGNNIDSKSLLNIGLLVSLRELHLSGNDIRNLPEEMARQLISIDNFGNIISQRDRFPLLKKLWLDHNLLQDVRIFAILAGLKKLEYLNLSNNKIFSLPHLHFLPKEVIERLGEGIGVEDTLLESKDQERLVNPTNSIENKRELSANSKGDNIDNIAKILSDISVISRGSPRHHSAVTLSDMGPPPDSNRPYPSLVELDLSSNLLYYPEDVVACSKWRSLKYIKLQGNPITTQQKGIPPILHTELVDKGKNVTLIDDPGVGEKAKKRANKLSVISAISAPIKINDTLPPLSAKKPLALTLNRDVTNISSQIDDVYTQSSSVTSVSQARTYPGTSPQGSGRSLFPSLPHRGRRPYTVVTGKMNELMSTDSPHYKHRRTTMDTDSQSLIPEHQFLDPSRETFFMTQSERDPKDDVDTDQELSKTIETDLTEKIKFYDLLPSECMDELREIFEKNEDDIYLTNDKCYKNINSNTRQLAHLLQHPLSLPALSYDLSGEQNTLDARYKQCIKRKNCMNKKGTSISPKSITYADNTTEQEVGVCLSLDEAIKTGGDREKREVQKLFDSLQHKYNKIRTSSQYNNDTDIPLSTHIQNPQVY